jgi:hypothetical protein
MRFTDLVNIIEASTKGSTKKNVELVWPMDFPSPLAPAYFYYSRHKTNLNNVPDRYKELVGEVNNAFKILHKINDESGPPTDNDRAIVSEAMDGLLGLSPELYYICKLMPVIYVWKAPRTLTFSVDGKGNLRINTGYLNYLYEGGGTKAVTALLAHEAYHKFWNHHARAVDMVPPNSLNWQICNICMDMFINNELSHSGYSPASIKADKYLRGSIAEGDNVDINFMATQDMSGDITKAKPIFFNIKVPIEGKTWEDLYTQVIDILNDPSQWDRIYSVGDIIFDSEKKCYGVVTKSEDNGAYLDIKPISKNVVKLMQKGLTLDQAEDVMNNMPSGSSPTII